MKKMKTASTVISKLNGSLKKKKENNNLRNILAGLFLSTIAFVGMSFTKNDFVKVADTVTKIKGKTQDSCCVVSITGNKQLITAANLGTEAKLSITNLSVKEMSAINLLKLRFIEISRIDKSMDINFILAERKNIEMAVAFKNNLVNQASEADSQFSENLIRTAFASSFRKNLLLNMELADGTIDKMLYEEADLHAKSIAFKSGLSSQLALADEHIDQMLNMNFIKNIILNTIQDADRLMDAQIQKSALSNFNKLPVSHVHIIIDEPINKN